MPKRLCTDADSFPQARSEEDQGDRCETSPSLALAPLPAPASRQLRAGTKGASVLALLHSSDGASLAALQDATGWQAHSVRGFLSGTLRKRLGLAVISVRDENGVCRYRIDAPGSDEMPRDAGDGGATTEAVGAEAA